ncbi:nucleotide-binding protein [Geodermatophilus sp. SYSU D00779]
MRPRIFVGSSTEAIDICRAVQSELDDRFDVTVWDQDVFRLSHSALESLLAALDSADAGIFVLQPDDVVTKRGTSDSAVRDNVIFELGMFIGRLGADRTFMLAPQSSGPRLPGDLLGVVTARYDAGRVARGERRAGVASACTKVRECLDTKELRMITEPQARARLDRAMGRLSRDLEWLLSTPSSAADAGDSSPQLSIRLHRALVHVEVGRIQDYGSDRPDRVVALPANEYFDDECVTDERSSLGAFVRHHYGADVEDFVRQVRAELTGVPSQRVPRTERRIDDSYGIGQGIFLKGPTPAHRVILVSATTERAGIGLRAEPHFLYAAIQGVIETMNANRLTSLSMPILGAGHGGMPVGVALLFNLLALRSVLREDIGRHVREVRIVIYEGSRSEIADTTLHDVMSRVALGG